MLRDFSKFQQLIRMITPLLVLNGLNKLQTEVIALKMNSFICFSNQMVAQFPEYNISSSCYIKSHIEQIDYLKEEKKMKNSIIQFLLYQNSSTAANSQIKNNNNNDSSSFSYSEDVVYPYMNKLAKKHELKSDPHVSENFCQIKIFLSLVGKNIMICLFLV